MRKLRELEVHFLPSCNVLTRLKQNENCAQDLEKNEYSYLYWPQWGVYKSAQKHTFSGKGSSRQETFVGEEDRLREAALGTCATIFLLQEGSRQRG